MDIVEEKGIEREPIVTELVTEIKEKPKRKPRSEAQKEAFEKARLVRAANLAKKKAEAEVQGQGADAAGEEEDQGQGADAAGEEEEPPPRGKVLPTKPAPKKRGRPKGSKLKREPVPEIGQFSPQNIPPQAGDIRYQYHQQPPPNWANYYQPPQPQLAPQVHNYYYGHQQGAIHSQQPVVDKPREPEPEYESESSGAEEEYEEYQPPQLRYRFA
jgi:hypothetical protein